MDRSTSRMLVFVLLGLGAAGLVVALIANRGGGAGWGPTQTAILAVIVVVAVAVGAVVLVLVMVASRRANRGSNNPAGLADLGLDYQAKAPSGFHRQFGRLPGIPNGGQIAHVLTGEVAGRPITAFQHYYMTMAGQTPVPVFHVVCVTDGPHWPGTTITRRGPIGWLLYRLGVRRGLVLENEAFNQGMKVRMDSEDFALTLLGPEMQQLILEEPGVTWRIGDGHVSMIRNGRMDFNEVGAMLDRLRRFWELVPPELEAW